MKNNTTQKNIPQDWSSVTISEIAEKIIGGGTPSRNEETYWGGDIPWVTVKDLTPGRFIYAAQESITKEGLQQSASNLIPVKSIITATRMAVGRFFINKLPIAINQDLKALIVRDKFDINFIYWALLSKAAYLESFGTGTTVKGIKLDTLRELELVVPNSIKEQKKIAEILSAVADEIAKIEEIISTTEKLNRGLMQNLFSFKDKKNVRKLALKEIGKVAMCKRVFKKETSNDGEIPFYKIGTFGKDPDAFISQKLYDTYRERFSFPKKGDILLSASGTIGRKVRYDGKPAYFQDSNIIWLEHDESKVLNDFLFYLYDSVEWQTEGSTIKRLYNDLFLKKVIPVPPIEEQRRVISILSSVEQKTLISKKIRSNLLQLKKGLMQDLLAGQVRTI